MNGNIKKFSPKIVGMIVECCREGYSDAKIARYLGISKNCMVIWKKKYPHLKKLMVEAKEESAKDAIESGLRKLSKGAKDETVTESYVTSRKLTKLVECEKTGEIVEKTVVVPVTRVSTTKVKAPDVKAIEVLSRKYYKDFDPKAEERDVASKVLEGFTMRQLQEARKECPIDAGKSEVVDAEYVEVEE